MMAAMQWDSNRISSKQTDVVLPTGITTQHLRDNEQNNEK